MKSLKTAVLGLVTFAALATSTLANSCGCSGVLWGYSCQVNCTEEEDAICVCRWYGSVCICDS